MHFVVLKLEVLPERSSEGDIRSIFPLGNGRKTSLHLEWSKIETIFLLVQETGNFFNN
jgi:hypothetical protein